MTLFKVGFPKFEFDGSELPLQDADKEVPAPARRFQEAGVDPLSLILHQIEHRLDHPRWGKDFPVVGNALFGLDLVYGSIHF